MSLTRYATSAATLVCVLTGCVPAVALAFEGTYGGPDCLNQKFDFRPSGDVFYTDVRGIEMGGTYRDSGDKIAISFPHETGLVLERSGSMLSLHVPRTPISLETTLLCRPIDKDGKLKAAGYLPADKRLMGCWKEVENITWERPDSQPRVDPENPVCHTFFEDEPTESVICGKKAHVAFKHHFAAPGLLEVELSEVPKGMEVMKGFHGLIHYTIEGDTLRLTTFGAESSPRDAIYKTESVRKRATTEQCRAF